MNFRCSRCGAEIAVSAAILEEVEGATVQCPECGARYRRKKRKPPPPASPQAAPAAPTAPSRSAFTATSAPTTVTPPAEHTDPTPAGAGAPPPTLPPRAERPVQRPTFELDQVVAERYRVLRFIARGGMGEVYEAHDLELDERVALKTVRPKSTSTELAVDRFKREIQLARKVTHPNICRIFDVGRHEPPTGAREGVVFLTMELLEGRTLAARLRDEGPLRSDEALPLIRQMSVGLAAAHRAGVVHRDLKSDNVMLVPDEAGLRAVITDFGVARATHGEDQLEAGVTSAGDLVGTPAYMAPEQVSGEPITGATDIYAFGIVIFEMLTAKVPFVAETPLATAAMRLTHDPPSPRDFAPDLHPRWEEGILRCLEREPANRFAGDAEEVGRFFAGEDAESLAQQEEAQREVFEAEKRLAVDEERRRTLAEEERKLREVEARSARSQRLRLALVLLLLIASGVLLYTRITQQLNSSTTLAGFPTDSITARQAVAVLGFRNVSERPELAWLSTALAEMFRTELSRGGELRLIPGENIARMKVELDLADVDSLATDTLLRVGENLGTDFVLLGSYVGLPGGSLRLDLRLQDAGDGRTLAALAENGSDQELFDLVSRSGEQLLEVLEVEVAASSADSGPALPTNPEAARLYAEGLDRLHSFDPQSARELLLEAAAIEPSNALVHEALSAALSALGYEKESLESARRAYDLASNLPEVQRLAVEGQYREAAQQWDRAAQIYETLWRTFPDNLEYGLRLAAALSAAGRGADALATVDVLRRLPSPASEDPRVDLAEASAAVVLGQFRRQEEAAGRAAGKAKELGAQLLVARSRVTQAEALRNLGRLSEAKVAVEQAREIYRQTGVGTGQTLASVEEANVLFASGDLDEARLLLESTRESCAEAGNQGCVLRVTNNLAVILRNQGDLARAKLLYEEVLDLARRLGSDIAEVNALNNLGAVLFTEGRLGEAKARFEESLTSARRLERKSTEALALSNMAAAIRGLGSLPAAKELLEEALEIRRDIGQVPGQIATMNALGAVALDQGDLLGAERLFEDALGMAASSGSESLRAEALFNLGEVSARQGLTVEARERFETSRDIRDTLGEKIGVARCDLALAEIAIDEAAPEYAESLARELVTRFAAAGAHDDEAMAQVVLSRALLLLGRSDEALQAVDEAARLAAASDRRTLDLATRIQRAHVLAERGGPEAAAGLLAAVASESQSLGLYRLELEARIGLGEMDGLTGQEEAARSRLRALEAEARQRGFGRLAHRAAEVTPR